MTTSSSLTASTVLRRCLALAAVSLIPLASAPAQEAAKSLVPAFGADGAEFTHNAQGGNKITGWLPNQWVDNSEWAEVAATYSKLGDAPKEGVGAVRIKVDKVNEGQMQLTTWQRVKFKKGTKYAVTGWVRSKDKDDFVVGIRMPGDPYEYYEENNLTTTPEWKRFEFVFTPYSDYEAILMFVKREAGSVDLAGVELIQK